jgi:hypothetical protein
VAQQVADTLQSVLTESMMRNAGFAALRFSLSVAVLAAGNSAIAQDSIAAYQGAWLSGIDDCAEVYTSTGKGTSFKKPVDIFAPAFIISGRRLSTPLASCRIQSVRPSGNRQLMVLGCSNAVSVNVVQTLISPQPDGSLKRFLNAQDTAGTTYKRCSG